jgi:putative SOS response-associated peptidase YedK
MCGRYLFLNGKNNKLQELAYLAEEKLDRETFEKISLNEVFPGSLCFAGIYDRSGGKHKTVLMNWGYPSSRKLIINARSETCFSSPFFSGSVPCVIPATAYYEWTPQKQRYEFTTGEDVFYMAALCRREKDGLLHHVILTEEASGPSAAIHHRQPVIFSYEKAKAWCQSETPALLLKYSADKRFFTKA